MTQQPPGGAPQGGYGQPQDPWAGGFEPGVASVPTDPIPQQYDPYAAVPPGEVWSPQGGSYPYVAQQEEQRGRTGRIIGIVILVLILGTGGGFGAWYAFQKFGNPNTGAPTNPTTPVLTTTGPAPFDPHAVKVGDCLFNFGTNQSPDLRIVPCSTEKSFKVVRVVTGESIVEGPDAEHQFVYDPTAIAACKGITFNSWYGFNNKTDDSLDIFFCMTNNP